MRILLIEDDAALCTVLVPVLEKAGFVCLKTEGAFGSSQDKTRVNFIAKRA